jgi:ABC-2 type transport system ATP-binding protein
VSEGSISDVLEARGLEKSYGPIKAVSEVGFHIAPGETYGLLGPNGAGKTTSISIVAGLLEADAGEVRVMGQLMSPRAVGPKIHVGLVPQDLAVYPDLTARENLFFFGRLYGMGKRELTSRAGQVLEVIGLSERADDRAKEFSGGMKRRLNIGIGLLHRPRLLILDEPTVGVDPQSRNAILESVEALAGEGMAVLYTTHYMEEAERLCDRLAIIDEGSIKAEGTRRELVQIVGQKDRVSISGSGPLTAVAEALSGLGGVTDSAADEQRVDLLVEDASSRLPELLAAAAAHGMAIGGVKVEEPNLEAAFLHLTGKALRD